VIASGHLPVERPPVDRPPDPLRSQIELLRQADQLRGELRAATQENRQLRRELRELTAENRRLRGRLARAPLAARNRPSATEPGSHLRRMLSERASRNP
jgi:chromosome segregation ATPase